jgi:hypothetical protein
VHRRVIHLMVAPYFHPTRMGPGGRIKNASRRDALGCIRERSMHGLLHTSYKLQLQLPSQELHVTVHTESVPRIDALGLSPTVCVPVRKLYSPRMDLSMNGY